MAQITRILLAAGLAVALVACASGQKASEDAPPLELAGAAPSVDALVDQFLDALARQDEAALQRTRVSKDEYVQVIMTGQVKKELRPASPYNNVSDFAWSLLDTKSLYYSQSLFKEFGGREVLKKKVWFTRPAREYPWYRALGELRVTVEDPDDGREYQLSSGWIAEVDGKYKFIGFEYDDD